MEFNRSMIKEEEIKLKKKNLKAIENLNFYENIHQSFYYCIYIYIYFSNFDDYLHFWYF